MTDTPRRWFVVLLALGQVLACRGERRTPSQSGNKPESPRGTPVDAGPGPAERARAQRTAERAQAERLTKALLRETDDKKLAALVGRARRSFPLGPHTLPNLLKLLDVEPKYEYRKTPLLTPQRKLAMALLLQVGPPAAKPLLPILRRHKGRADIPAAALLLRLGNAAEQQIALKQLRQILRRPDLDDLKGILLHEPALEAWRGSRIALAVLRQVGDARLVPDLLALWPSKPRFLDFGWAEYLTDIAQTEAVRRNIWAMIPGVRDSLKEVPARMRTETLATLAALGPAAKGPLLRALRRGPAWRRCRAAMALRQPDPDVKAALQAAARTGSACLKREAARSLMAIGKLPVPGTAASGATAPASPTAPSDRCAVLTTCTGAAYPASTTQGINDAFRALRAGRYRSCICLAHHYLATAPPKLAAGNLYTLGRCYERRGCPTQAATYFARSVSRTPATAPLRRIRCKACLRVSANCPGCP